MKRLVKGKGAHAGLRSQRETGVEDRSAPARECTVNSYGTKCNLAHVYFCRDSSTVVTRSSCS
jgi:hypothetical protein